MQLPTLSSCPDSLSLKLRPQACDLCRLSIPWAQGPDPLCSVSAWHLVRAQQIIVTEQNECKKMFWFPKGFHGHRGLENTVLMWLTSPPMQDPSEPLTTGHCALCSRKRVAYTFPKHPFCRSICSHF